MIGILGGTFDPIHYAHLRCAVEVKALFGLEQVRLIPNATPPHRDVPSTPPQMRAAMVELAIQNHPGLLCDRRELARTEPSYMVDTLASLHHDFPGKTLVLFIGNDAFTGLTRWYRWQQLFDYAHVVVMTRPGSDIGELQAFFQTRVAAGREDLQTTPAGKLFFQTVTPLDISATAIRDSLAKQQDPSFLLPDAVIEYIHQHRLYQPTA